MNFKVISTVTQAASSYDLTTLQAVKDELSVTNGASDAILQRYLSGASAAAAQFCNRVFTVETLSESFLPLIDPSRVLFVDPIAPLQLSRWPIVAVTTVTENGTVLVADTDFVVDKVSGSLTRLDVNGLPKAWCSLPVVVVYSAGFSPIPADLEDAVIRMITKRWSAKGRDATLKAETIPGVLERQFWIATGEDAGNLTPDIADVLDNYRVPVQV